METSNTNHEKKKYADVKPLVDAFIANKKKKETEQARRKEKLETLAFHIENTGVSVKKQNGSSNPKSSGAGDGGSSKSDNKEVNFQRGIQAFDLSLNPNVEEIIKTAKGDRSIKYVNNGGNPTPQCVLKAKEILLKKVHRRRNALHHRSSGIVSRGERFQRYKALHNLSKTFQFTGPVQRTEKIMEANNTTELPWLEERLEISSRSNRFEIPMDVLELQDLTPMEYLRRFCVLGTERAQHYKFKFNRMSTFKKTTVDGKPIKEWFLLPERIEPCLFSALFASVELDEKEDNEKEAEEEQHQKHCIYLTKDEMQRFLRWVGLKPQETLDLRGFSVICALAERILYGSYLKLKQLKFRFRPDPRSFLEQADFTFFAEKIEGLSFKSPHLVPMLFSLR